MATAAEMYSILVREVDGAQELRNKVQMISGMVVNDIVVGNDTSNPPYDQTKKARDRRLLFTAQLFFDDFVQTFFSCVISWARDKTQAEILNLSDADIKTAIEVTIDGMAISFEP